MSTNHPYREEMRRWALVWRHWSRMEKLEPENHSFVKFDALKNSIQWREFHKEMEAKASAKRPRYFNFEAKGEAKKVSVKVTATHLIFRKHYERETFEIKIIDAMRHAQKMTTGNLFTEGELDEQTR